MKKLAFIDFTHDDRTLFESMIDLVGYEADFFDTTMELLENMEIQSLDYQGVFISSKRVEFLGNEVQQLKRNLKTTIILVRYDNTLDCDAYDVDLSVNIETINPAHFFTLAKASQMITSLMRDEIKRKNHYYQYEFFKKLVRIEIKRAQRYDIPLTIIYLTIDNEYEIRHNDSNEIYEELFEHFKREISANIRDLDLPMTYGSESILLMMPHTTKSGANIVAERIFKNLLKKHPRIRFSIAIAGSDQPDFDFKSMMAAIHNGIDQSRQAGSNKIVVK